MQVQLLLSAPTKRGKDITLPLFVGINLVISTGVDGGGANGSERFAQKEIILRITYAN